MTQNLIPGKATRMELFIVYATLRTIRERILSGVPSGQVIDQALDEALERGTSLNPQTN